MPSALHSTSIAARHRSAWPRTGALPITGETPTTGAGVARIASRMPGTARIVPIDTTGLDGAISTRSAPAMAASTPGPGVDSSAPIGLMENAGSAPVRGHADRCLAAIDVECSAEGIGRHYGARRHGGILDGFLIAEDDTADIPGVTVLPRPLLMSDPQTTAVMVAACAEVAGVR